MAIKRNSIAETQKAVDVSVSDYTGSAFALFVGVAGDVKVDAKNGEAGVVYTMGAGTILPVWVTKVYNSGTTASGLVALK